MILALLCVLIGVALALLLPGVLAGAGAAAAGTARSAVETLAAQLDPGAGSGVSGVYLGISLLAGLLAPGVLGVVLMGLAGLGTAVQRVACVLLVLLGLGSFAVVGAGEALALTGVAAVAAVLVILAGRVVCVGLQILAGALATTGLLLAVEGRRTGGDALRALLDLHLQAGWLGAGVVLVLACIPLLVLPGVALRR